MKKLKTWQIVLLVIFYPVGICVWIYRAIKRSQLKKAREAEQAALSARREAERAEREKFEAVRAQISRHRSERREWLDANCDYVSFKLVGVTFNNDDGVGRNRQDILREIEEDGELDNFSYDTYDYEGNTAVGVYYNGEQIGNIAQTDLKKFLSRTVSRTLELVSLIVSFLRFSLIWDTMPGYTGQSVSRQRRAPCICREQSTDRR